MAQMQGGGSGGDGIVPARDAFGRPIITNPQPGQGQGYGIVADLETLKRVAAEKAKTQANASINSALGAPAPQKEVDYLALARQMFAPQTEYLDQQAAQAKARSAQTQAAVGGMYDQVAKEILAQQGSIKQNYGQGISGTEGAYKQSMGDVEHTFDKSRNDQLAILQRLGITQAAPNTLSENADAKAFIEGILGANNQASTNALRQMQSASQAFNTEQGNITRQQGAEAKYGIGLKLEDLLGQIAGNKADLMGQINQQAMSMRTSADNSAYDRFKDERDFNYKQAKDRTDYELQLQKLATGGKAAAGPSDPLGKVNNLAMQLYGNPQSASNATKAINDALMAGGKDMNSVDDLIRLVIERNKRANGVVNDAAELSRLAALAWSEMMGKSTAPGASPFGG